MRTKVDNRNAEANTVNRKPAIGQNVARKIIIQAYHAHRGREKPRFERVSEAEILGALPVVRAIFKNKWDGAFTVCYDPENTGATRPRPWHEKILFIEELINVKIKEGPEYDEIVGWSSARLWTYTHCLVRFLSKIPLPYTSFMTTELHDVANVCVLAKHLGTNE